MGNNLSLIHLPAQSGKTRKMTDLINRWKAIIGNEKSEHHLNVIFTSNTKLLVKQTKKRVIRDVDNRVEAEAEAEEVSDMSDFTEDDDTTVTSLGCDDNEYDDKADRTIAWIHEPKKNCPKSKDVNALFADIIGEDLYDNIICCSNAARVKRVFELLTKLNAASKRGRFPKRVSIWVDEADACINIWKKYIHELAQMGDFIASVVMITATMMPVYKCLTSKRIACNLRVYENTHAEVYHKYSESNIIHQHSESADNVTEYISKILTTTPAIPGSKWFCPGDKRKISHEQVCAVLLEKGFNVLILNGYKKEIRYADKREPIQIMIKLEDDLEIAKTLNDIYYSNGLFSTPFAVTGHLCIGRGITFASQELSGEFIFTHGIIPDISNGEEAYQIVSRCSGNIKGFATYQPPQIFISPKMHEKIMEQERCAIDLTAKLYVENVETVLVTRNHINAIVGRQIISDQDCIEVPSRGPRVEKVSNSTIPVKVLMKEYEYLEIIEMRDMRNHKQKIHDHIITCIGNGRMTIEDKNVDPENRFRNPETGIINRTLKTIRMYEAGQDTKTRRFKNFHDAHESNKEISQAGKEDQYNLDFAITDYEHETNGFKNNHLIAWITFKKQAV